MKSSEITKSKVLQEAITLFNTKGYRATSLSDITNATGLTKGAIYRHFENKEQLEKWKCQQYQRQSQHQLKTKLQQQLDDIIAPEPYLHPDNLVYEDINLLNKIASQLNKRDELYTIASENSFTMNDYNQTLKQEEQYKKDEKIC